MIRKLPPSWTAWLDLMALGLAPTEEEEAAFLAALDDLEEWRRWQGTFCLDEHEAADFANLDVVLGELRQGHDVYENLLEAAARMEAVTQRRERAASYSRQPVVNDLILAGLADPEAVRPRLEHLRAYLSNLAVALGAATARLRPEVADAFRQGLAAMDEACQELAAEPAQPTLRKLAEGAEIMQQFLDWQHQDPSPMGIPFVGAALDRALAVFQRGSDSLEWELHLADLKRNHWPRLLAFWQAARHRVFLPQEQREDCVQAVDERLAALSRALFQEPPTLSEELLNDLSDAFCEIQERIPTGRPGGQEAELLEAFTAVAQGHHPILALRENLASWTVPAARFLRLYCRDGERHHLYEGILELLATPAEAAGPAPTWACLFCGQRNPAGVTPCANCGPRRR